MSNNVGITSVPELAAKPIIDINVVIADGHVPECMRQLTSLGYRHEGNLGVPEREAFERPAGTAPRNRYLRSASSPALANSRALRDHLRSNPSEARAYGEL